MKTSNDLKKELEDYDSAVDQYYKLKSILDNVKFNKEDYFLLLTKKNGSDNVQLGFDRNYILNQLKNRINALDIELNTVESKYNLKRRDF